MRREGETVRIRVKSKRGRPPVRRKPFDVEAVLRELAEGAAEHCGDMAMRIARDGTWYYRGTPIRRPELVRLFATALYRAPDGRHWLLTPFERIPVEVEDTPDEAVALERLGSGRDQRLLFRTRLGAEPVLGRDADWRLVRRGAALVPHLLLPRGLEARVARSVYYQLADLATTDGAGAETVLGVWSAGRFFPLEESEAKGADGG